MFFFFPFFFSSWVDFDRNCCSKTTIEIKLAVQNSKNLTLICIFWFRRDEVGDPLLQNTAAASTLVSGFAEQNSSSGSLSTWHKTTKSLMALHLSRGRDSLLFLSLPTGRLQNRRGLCCCHWRAYSLCECYPGFCLQWNSPLVIMKGMFLETALLFNGCR